MFSRELVSHRGGLAIVDPELLADSDLPTVRSSLALVGWRLILDFPCTEAAIRAAVRSFDLEPAAVTVWPFDDDRLQSLLGWEQPDLASLHFLVRVVRALGDVRWEFTAAVIRVISSRIDSKKGFAAAASATVEPLIAWRPAPLRSSPRAC